MKEKYGFVYIWYDRKHKRYYVGAHWGYEDDGYICSSNWMKSAYRKRPEDFKRRIIKKIYTNRKDTFLEEQKYLYLIKDSELRNRYYNLQQKAKNNWSDDIEKDLSRKIKISIKTKEAMSKPEVREKYLKGLETRNTRSSDESVRLKRSQTMLNNRRNKGKITVKDSLGNVFHTTREDIRWLTGEISHITKGLKRDLITNDYRQKLSETSHFNKINKIKIKCEYCDFEGNIGNLARYHNNKCKHKAS